MGPDLAGAKGRVRTSLKRTAYYLIGRCFRTGRSWNFKQTEVSHWNASLPSFLLSLSYSAGLVLLAVF